MSTQPDLSALVSSDRTQRTEAERENEVLLRIAGRVARLGGWSLELATRKAAWSEEVCAIHEVPAGFQPTVEEGIEFYAPEYRDLVQRCVEACSLHGTPFDFEMELVTARGRRIWVRAIGEAVRDAEGRIVRLQGAFQDISDRKQIEEGLRRLTERLTTTLESIKDGLFTLDRDWRFTYVNAEAERLTLRARAELLGITLWEAFPAAVGSTFEREFRRAFAENVTVGFEEYFPPLEKWFEVRAYPSDQGLAIYFLDVTAARRTAHSLRVSEERFRLLSKAASDAIWEWDMVSGALSWNEGVTTLFGYSADEVGSTVDFRLEHIHPDDLDRVNATVQAAIEGKAESWTSEYRFRREGGGYTPVLDSGYIIRDAAGVPVRMLGGMKDLTQRHHIEESLLLRDRAIQAVSQGIFITDPRRPDNPVIYASAGVERITGYRSDEVYGKNARFLQGADTDPETARKLREAIAAGRACSVEILNYRKGGAPFWNAMSVHPIRDAKGTLLYFVGVQSDITERRELETQLQQAQKMEAVGRLAGGVAHDFNNLLTVITGYAEVVLESPDVTEHTRGFVTEIQQAGKRAAALTRQLLAFSRQSLLQPRVLSLNGVVAETSNMLRRLIGEHIQLSTVLDPALRPVRADPGHLGQVLMNLAVNARDAMPRSGKLTIETANVLIGEDYGATHLDCKVGPHVMLAMSDTGAGMTPDVQARIFEPFFTTKGVGEGTGLGLSMVFGIVRQSGGCIHVYSEPGHGTTFKIYLPAVDGSAPEEREAPRRSGARGEETILLVEDEDGVRRLAARVLRAQGYQVLTATDGRDALRVVEAHEGPLGLLLTDVVMPHVGGPELAGRIRARFPELRVLFMSGYTDDAVVRHGLLEADVAFLQKPYTPLALARKVRQVLDGDAQPHE